MTENFCCKLFVFQLYTSPFSCNQQVLYHNQLDQQQQLHIHGFSLLHEAWLDHRYQCFQSHLHLYIWFFNCFLNGYKLTQQINWSDIIFFYLLLYALALSRFAKIHHEYLDVMFLHDHLKFQENLLLHLIPITGTLLLLMRFIRSTR